MLGCPILLASTLTEMIAAMLLFAFGQRADAVPVFLDSQTRIRVWVEQPTTESALQKGVQLSVGGRSMAIDRIEKATPVTDDANVSDPNLVTFPGTIQGALGGKDWTPSDESSAAVEVRPGVFELVVKLPKGNYQYKCAKGGSWGENYGADFKQNGGNINLNVLADNQIVRIVADFNQKTLLDSVNHPERVSAPATAPERKRKERPNRVFEVVLKDSFSLSDVDKPTFLTVQGQSRRVIMRGILDHSAFQYAANDLGANYSAKETTFKVWSPVSRAVYLDLKTAKLAMRKGSNGVWTSTIKGDLHGKPYRFEFLSYDESKSAPDIESKSVDAESKWSYVVDLKKTNPDGFGTISMPLRKSVTDAIIYEVHVRDFSIDPNSGVDPKRRGKYIGMVQEGTRVPGTQFSTGIDYLKKLGVTDVHLLPIQNFNPGNSKVYNWGYETNLFNVPEEQYSTDPDDPFLKIRECKQMVHGFHKNGLRVILDVVYNHTVPSEGPGSAFDVAVPYYYFRTDDRGRNINESGVGNAVHDERPMVRKYIINSLKYWMNEYRVDGFRFDLLGMFAQSSVKAISDELHKVRADVLIYGEPWTGGGPNRFPKGAQKGLKVAVFNDHFRNAVRGDLDGDSKGFATGGGSFDEVKRALMGSIDDFAAAPTETINYVSAHDNMTLFDRFANTVGNDVAKQKEAVKRAGSLVLLSQGIPFIEGGSEMGRTKGGNHNSYNAGDAVNQFDWKRATQFQDVINHYRNLINTRKTTPSLRYSTAEEVRKNVRVSQNPGGSVRYEAGRKLFTF